MSTGRIASVFAATVLAAGAWVAMPQAAFAHGVDEQDGEKVCISQAEGSGVKDRDAGQACSEAKGGDKADCASMVKADSSPAVNDEAAADACGKAAPPAVPDKD